MSSWIAFCAFFLVFPIVIVSLRRIMQIVTGPKGDELYHQQVYKRTVRKAIYELVVLNAVLVIVIYYVVRVYLVSR